VEHPSGAVKRLSLGTGRPSEDVVSARRLLGCAPQRRDGPSPAQSPGGTSRRGAASPRQSPRQSPRASPRQLWRGQLTPRGSLRSSGGGGGTGGIVSGAALAKMSASAAPPLKHSDSELEEIALHLSEME
jgi:hypothetical protein